MPQLCSPPYLGFRDTHFAFVTLHNNHDYMREKQLATSLSSSARTADIINYCEFANHALQQTLATLALPVIVCRTISTHVSQ